MWKLIIFNCILGFNYQIVTTNLNEGNSSALDYKSEFEKFKVRIYVYSTW